MLLLIDNNYALLLQTTPFFGCRVEQQQTVSSVTGVLCPLTVTGEDPLVKVIFGLQINR